MTIETAVTPSSGVRRYGWWLTMAMATFVALASTRYLAGGALMTPPPLKANFFAHPLAFYVHITAASTALLIGPWQFVDRLRRKRQLPPLENAHDDATGALLSGVPALYAKFHLFS